MRVLVLGGTVFFGHAVAAEALRRGHEVLCAARGTSGAAPDGTRLVPVDRDDPDGLAPLAGERFDAVIDVATISYPWVQRALDALGEHAGHWTFVSSISAYADTATPGLDTSGPLLPPLRQHSHREDPAFQANPDLYGSIKVASEDAVRERLGERAFVLRAGLIIGPGDVHDRFGYWPARFAQPGRCGGRVLVPEAGEQLTQFIDVRDLAAWVLDAAEHGLTGTFDGTGPVQRLDEVLRDIAALVGPECELVPVPPPVLTAAGVRPWSGPKSLPLWLPDTHLGLCAKDVTASIAAGMPTRPLTDVVAGALAWERELGLDRPRKAGLSAEEEGEVLASVV